MEKQIGIQESEVTDLSIADHLGHHRVVLIGLVTLIFQLPYLILAANVDIASTPLVPIGLALYSVSSPSY